MLRLTGDHTCPRGRQCPKQVTRKERESGAAVLHSRGGDGGERSYRDSSPEARNLALTPQGL